MRPIVTHPESGISFCRRHFVTVPDADGTCPKCAAPRPTVYVDPTAVKRWKELAASTLPPYIVIAFIQHVVTEGAELPGNGKFPESIYYVHPDFPDQVVVVVPTGGRRGGAAVTVLDRGDFEEFKA